MVTWLDHRLDGMSLDLTLGINVTGGECTHYVSCNINTVTVNTLSGVVLLAKVCVNIAFFCAMHILATPLHHHTQNENTD